jgi:drug/metabolite transporter (DMT)-like permease
MASSGRRSVLLAFVCLVLGAVAMGASPVFVRLADVGPQASAFWRTFLALPFLAAWAMLERRRSPRAWSFDRAVLLAGLFFAGDLFFWHLSILGTRVANAAFLATTAPVWVALGASFLLAEAIGIATLAGIALCILGGAALLGQSYSFAPQRLAGDLYGVTTALFFAAYMLAVRAARFRHGAAALSLIATTITSACLLVVALFVEPRLLPRSAQGAATLVALALVSQVGGQGLLAVALGTLPATFSSLVIFLEAIAAAAFGWALLDEPLGPWQVLGGLLILLGIWIARPRTQPLEAGP